MNQDRLARNIRPGPQQAAGAVREGSALLQGLATCGRCGRKLRVYYQGRHSSPGYYCANSQPCGGRAVWCMRVGAVRIDRAVSETFLAAICPAGLEAALEAQKLNESEQQTALKQWRLQVEHARYEAERAERRYREVEPENRLAARTLETEWEQRLSELRTAEAELLRKQQESRIELTEPQRERIRALGTDLKQVWEAPTTTDRDRKELLSQRRQARAQQLLSRFLALSPHAAQYYQRLAEKRGNPRHHVQKIVALSEIYGPEKVQRALEDAWAYQAFSCEYIANLLEQQARPQVQPGALHLTRQQDLLDLELPAPDLSLYDSPEGGAA